MKVLVKHCDRLTKGLSRDALAAEAKTNKGSGINRFMPHALMRDIMDAANAGRAALADQPPQDGSRDDGRQDRERA